MAQKTGKANRHPKRSSGQVSRAVVDAVSASRVSSARSAKRPKLPLHRQRTRQTELINPETLAKTATMIETSDGIVELRFHSSIPTASRRDRGKRAEKAKP
jgi:hypothetical protein